MFVWGRLLNCRNTLTLNFGLVWLCISVVVKTSNRPRGGATKHENQLLPKRMFLLTFGDSICSPFALSTAQEPQNP